MMTIILIRSYLDQHASNVLKHCIQTSRLIQVKLTKNIETFFCLATILRSFLDGFKMYLKKIALNNQSVCPSVNSFFFLLKCELASHPTWLTQIKALGFIDRAIMLVEAEESRWTAPLVSGPFQLVSSRVADGRGAWEFGPSFTYMRSLLRGSWPLCSPSAHQPLPSQRGSSRSYQAQD